MDRRDFMKAVGAGAAATAAAGIPGARAVRAEPAKGEGIRRYSKLGKTDLKISDISFGGGKLSDPLLVNVALDLGINYFDTAPDYGSSEETLGKVFKNKEKRDKAILVTKMCKPVGYPGHHKPGTKAEVLIGSAQDSLKRLNTDRIDILMVHALGEKYDYKKTLKDEEMLKALDKMKKSGMVRYAGVSSHGPLGMEPGLKAAASMGAFDMIMPAFNHLKHDKLKGVLKIASEKGVGVVAMKTLAGGKTVDLSSFEEPGASYEHSAFKWVNSHPEVAGLIVTMDSVDKIKKYAGASGKKLGALDVEILQRYAKAHGADYCRTGCGDCVGSCPMSAAIPQIFRYDMYFTSYGQERMAMEQYAALPAATRADSCLGCDAPCDGACPHGLKIREKMIQARERLDFSVHRNFV